MSLSQSLINQVSIFSVLAITAFSGSSHGKANAILNYMQCPAAESVQEKNKRIVLEFYELAFNQFHPVEAANKYLVETYIQHNPGVADGRQGFIEAFAGSTADDGKTYFKRVIADGDLVVLHSHYQQNSQDLGVAVVDIFRVAGDHITEHWDVGQKVPAKSKNNNTMF